jgi:CubicO group peptidase (beta-lactamase class C family)
MLDLLSRVPAPAVAVSVFTPDAVVFRCVRGTADLTTGRPAGPDDWWDLASLTKVLVTLPEVLALADDGLLGLDEPVGAWTARQLLSHSAGLAPTGEFFREHSGRDAILAAVHAVPPAGAPGGVAAYSDLGFLILGELVEKLRGQSLAELAVRRTGLRFPPLPGPAVATEQCPWRGRLISGEVHDENAWAMGAPAGHAGAFGTLDLVTNAARAWLADAVVSPALHAQARRCWATNPQGERFGLGWWLTPTRGLGGPSAGPGSYGASGFVGNRIWFEPDRGYGVVVLSNHVHPVRGDRALFAAWTHELFQRVSI